MVLRSDQRQLNQLRPVTLTRQYTRYAPGSVLVSFGHTQVLVTATIEEKVPRHIHQTDNPNEGWLTAEYAFLPGSTQTRTQRERNKVSGRTYEIQRLIGRTLRAAVDLDRLGARTITIDADVLQADGGTRVAAITGGYVALVDALTHLKTQGLLEELPIVSPVAAVSVGLFQGDVLLDLNYEEDFQAEVDANVVMNAKNEFIEVQLTSEGTPFDRGCLDQMLDVAGDGITQLLSMQQEALAQGGVLV